MKPFLSWYGALLMALLLAACGGEDGGAPAQADQGGGTGVTMESLALTPAQGSIPVGLGQQFIALAIMSDGSVRDVTNDSTLHWSTSHGDIATISATGLALGISPGKVAITASGTAMGAHFSATAELTVTSPVVTALQVTPSTASVPVGFEQAFVATAILSDGSALDVTNNAALSWSSSDPAIASIDSSNKGLALAKAEGTVTITASGTNFSATAQLTVTSAVVSALQITPATASLPVGFEQAFVATAILSDGSSLDITSSAVLSWSSSDPAIASIDNGSHKGVATAKAVGSVTITASGTAKSTSFSATTKLVVTNAVVTALQVTPATAFVPVGFEQAFVATAFLSDGSSLDITRSTALSWSSSDPAIASIDSHSGLATGVSLGNATITASGTANGSHFSAAAELRVTSAVVTGLQIAPAVASVPIGFEQAFTATATLSDGSSLDITTSAVLSWSSSDPAIASIDNGNNKGLATGKATGIVTIIASGSANGTQFSSAAQLTVTSAVVTSLQITPATASIPVGFEQAFVATAILSDGSSLDVTNNAALSWTSSDPTIATIGSNNGLATGITMGNVTITAAGTTNGTPFSAAAELTVTSAVVAWVQVTPVTASVPVGFEQAFVATAILSDGSSLDITDNAALSWSSNNPAIATINSKNGLATGVAPGNITITASGNAQGTHFSATAELTVTGAIVVALQATPAMASIPVGLEQPFMAMALMSDGTLVDMTISDELSWSSSDPDIATIDIQSGVARGIAEGTAIVTASGIAAGTHLSVSAQLTVTGAVVTGLQLTPAAESIPVGFDQAFVATATLSDGSSLDVTNSASLSWSSSDQTIATIANGIAVGRAEGVASISASSSINGTHFSATAELTVRVPSGCDMGSLTNLGSIFICPPTQVEADNNGISYSTPWLEYEVMFVLMTWEQADTYCNDLGNGYRLPTREELRDLYFRYPPLHTHAGWPFQLWYWTSSGLSGTHSAVNITNGDSDSRIDTSVLYVSCIRPNM